MFGKSFKLFTALRIAEKSLGIDIYKMLGGTATVAAKSWRQGAERLAKPEINTKELALLLSPEFAVDVADDLIKRRRVEHQVKKWVEDKEVSYAIAKAFIHTLD